MHATHHRRHVGCWGRKERVEWRGVARCEYWIPSGDRSRSRRGVRDLELESWMINGDRRYRNVTEQLTLTNCVRSLATPHRAIHNCTALHGNCVYTITEVSRVHTADRKHSAQWIYSGEERIIKQESYTLCRLFEIWHDGRAGHELS